MMILVSYCTAEFPIKEFTLSQATHNGPYLWRSQDVALACAGTKVEDSLPDTRSDP